MVLYYSLYTHAVCETWLDIAKKRPWWVWPDQLLEDGGKAAVCPWLVHTAIPLLACEI